MSSVGFIRAVSLASGLGMVAAPRAFGRLYGLPQDRRWLLATGLRDVLIGLGLGRAEQSRRWLRARALADLTDGALIAAEHRALKARPASTATRIALALASAVFSLAVGRAIARESAGRGSAVEGSEEGSAPGRFSGLEALGQDGYGGEGLS